MACSTMERVLLETLPPGLSTRETVDLDTPAFFATSDIEAMIALLPFRWNRFSQNAALGVTAA